MRTYIGRSQRLWKRLYPIPDDAYLKYSVAFTYEDSMQGDKQSKRKDLLGGVDPLYVYDKREGGDDKVYKHTATAKMTGEEDEISAMNVWAGFSIDMSIGRNEKEELRNISFQLLFTVCIGRLII